MCAATLPPDVLSFVRAAEATLAPMQLPSPPLEHAARTVARNRAEGLWLEFGAGTGTTARVLAAVRERCPPGPAGSAPPQVITFDSWAGLPEDWRPGFPAGSLAMPPPAGMPPSVAVVTGLFADTLPAVLAAHPGAAVDLAHIDCDVYSSTRDVLNLLTPRLTRGSVLVFDELLWYAGCEDHEAKALYEWLQANPGLTLAWVGVQGTLGGPDVLAAAEADPTLKARLLGPDRTIVPWDMPLAERVAMVVV